jgi:hypothetical protein
MAAPLRRTLVLLNTSLQVGLRKVRKYFIFNAIVFQTFGLADFLT